MDICQVYATFPPITTGGVEQHIISLSRYLEGLGNSCFLVTPRYGIAGRWSSCGRSIYMPKEETFEDLEIHRVGLLFSPHLKRRYVEPFLRRFIIKVDSLAGAYMWFKRTPKSFDVVHAHSGYFSFDLGVRLSKWSKTPLVVSVHQKLGFELGDTAPSYGKFKKVLEKCSKVIVHRNSTRKVIDAWGLEQKTVFLPMVIDTERYKTPADFHQSNNNIRILSVGRLDQRKDPITLLCAFALLKKENPDVELHIVGDGLLKGRLIQLISQLDLEKSVFLHGLQLDIRRFLWDSDIFVSTNVVDNYPSLALREAMAAGMPVVATDVGETNKLISNGANGLLIKPSDSVSLSETLVSLIEDNNLRKKISKGSQLTSEDFNLARRVQDFNKIYRCALLD